MRFFSRWSAKHLSYELIALKKLILITFLAQNDLRPLEYSIFWSVWAMFSFKILLLHCCKN